MSIAVCFLFCPVKGIFIGLAFGKGQMSSGQQFKGIFTPALFSSVESNPGVFTLLVKFVLEGVNTSIAVRCGPKQPDRDLVEKVVSVRFQTNSGTVCLW